MKEPAMPHHPALMPGRVAVVTGAASGIGLAAARRFAGLGMKVCLADVDEGALAGATEAVAAAAARPGDVMSVRTDVSRREDVEHLKALVDDAFGAVAVLMNNAGREGGGQLFGDPQWWQRILETNLWGVVNGIQVFGPAMVAQKQDGAIISTGSKQGITTPPGDTAYNVSKAGVKVVTEALAHELRNIEGCRISAHLLIPGFTFTGFTRARMAEKPAAAWSAEQVIDFMVDAMGRGDFYILCPDNEVSRPIDEKRIRWAAEDIIENRPALSRWHPGYKDIFADYMRSP
jgi:NAD(P)-dependent dehydrogenase (short-subunit alcohol dehydrogenase family)